MAKQLLFLLSFCCFKNVGVRAQQLPIYLQYSEFHGLINPASLGTDFLADGQTHSFGLSYSKWLNMGYGTPSTQVARAEFINYDNHLLGGVYLSKDHCGISDLTGIHGRTAYILPLWGALSKGGISVGLNYGINLGNFNIDKINWDDGPESLDGRNQPFGFAEIGTGIYVYRNIKNMKSHYVYAGLSALRAVDFGNKDDASDVHPHFYGILGYYFPLNNGFFEVSSWTRQYKNIPAQTSMKIRWTFPRVFSAGGGILWDTGLKNSYFQWECAFFLTTKKNRTYRLGLGYSPNRTSQEFFSDMIEFNLSYSLDRRK